MSDVYNLIAPAFPDLSEDTIWNTLNLAVRLVNRDCHFNPAYDVSVSEQTITPEPTTTAQFLFVLRALSMLEQTAYRQEIRNNADVRLGPAHITKSGERSALVVATNEDYQKALDAFTMGKDLRGMLGVLTPIGGTP